MLYVDSTLCRDHKAPGKINLDQIKSKMSKLKNMVFMHFPPCIQAGVDKNIPNSKELIATCLNYIFYGHQHGFVPIPDLLGKDTDMHAVGTLLKDDVSEHEFILLDLANSRINYAYRYIHNEVAFTPEILLPAKSEVHSDRVRVEITTNQQPSCLKRKVKTIFAKEKPENSNEPIWNHFIGADLDEYVKENNLIVLCGDAGSGKTFELQRIYQSYISNEDYFPIWVKLKSVSSDKLSEYIGYCKNTIERKTPMLIFDGLDEMQSEIRNEFICDISSAVVGDVEIKVIISVRTALSQTLDGFIQCNLVDVDDAGIKLYAKSKGIDAELFYEAVCDSGCLGLARKPFNLVEMANIFANTNTLPKEIDLLELMVNKRFYDSDKKHSNAFLHTGSLIENEALLHRTLSEIAFFMQVRKDGHLSNLNYTEMWNLDVRQLLCRTGVLSNFQTDNVALWEFEHNNFREYFAAKYLNQFSFDEIISIIVYDESRAKLRPSWLNVVAYLLPLQNDDRLMNWLIANAKDALCNFESDKLPLKDRNQLFMCVMNDAITKQVPIFSLYDVEKLGRYFQSAETISFMLEIIKTNSNSYAISSTLHVLRCCENFFGKENDLKTAIIEKSLRDTNHEHIVALSVEVLTRIFSSNLTNIAAEVFSVLCEERRGQAFAALCNLLVDAGVVDNYINSIINTLTSYKDMMENFSAHSGIENVFTNVRTVSGVNSVIKFFCNEDLPYVLNSKNGVFAYNSEKAAELYKQGDTTILDVMIDCFVAMASKCDRRKCQTIKQFFINTGTLSVAFEEMLNCNLQADSMMFIIEDIMDETLEETLIAKYLNTNTIDEAFKWYARRLPINSDRFIKLDNAVLKKDNVRIQREPQIDWNKNRKEYNQNYFNCLFDNNLFSQLLEELLLYIKNSDITCGQLVSIFSSEIYDFSAIPHERQDLQNIRTALFHCGFAAHKVADFFDYINWEAFCTHEMCRMLEQNKMDIEVDDSQKQYINDYLQNQLAVINFEDYPEDTIDLNSKKYSMISDLIKLATQVNFDFSDDKLLEMLVLPWYMFVSSTSAGESETLKFIASRISEPIKLQEKILENIKHKKLKPIAAETHILYCLENKLSDAIDFATTLFNSNLQEAKHYKNTAADYLLLVKGNKFVDDLVPQIIDCDLLRYLTQYMKVDNTNLISKLVDENTKSEPQTLLLIELLELNNSYALETYLKLATRANSLPDMNNDDSRFGEITMSIREINDISLIDVISKLFEVCYSEGFTDKENFGLRCALDAVINNFTQVDKQRTKEMLTDLISKHSGNSKLISICNWHLNNIEKLMAVSDDSPWNLNETMDFLNSHRT